MLRDVKNKHIKPRIVPFRATLSATAANVAVNTGYGDYSIARASAGTGTLTLKEPFSRNCLPFLSQETTTGGYTTFNSATGLSATVPFTLLNTGGSAVDGVVSGFTFGWDSTDLSLCSLQDVAATISSPRVIWGKVTGTTGAVAINAKDFECTRTAAGTYTVTFRRSFGSIPVVMVTGSGNASTSVANRSKVTSVTAEGCVVTMAPESGTPTDGDFYILAIGTDGRSDAAKGRMPLENSQRKPRIVAGRITVATGVPTISIGGATGETDLTSIVDGGAGDFSFTISQAFAREPAIFLTTTTQSAEVVSYTAGVVRIKTKNATGDDTDVNGVTSIFIIGTDVNETF
jgi:hypothetical protein